MLVHPFWFLHRAQFSDELPEEQKVREIARNIIFSSSRRIPVVLLEESSYIANLVTFSLLPYEVTPSVFVVPTLESSPVPVFPQGAFYSEEKSWDFLVDILKSSGVTEIYVGGIFYFKKESPLYSGCVGLAFWELNKRAKGEIKVILTNLTAPHKEKNSKKGNE